MDIFYLVLILAFFAIFAAVVYAFKRLSKSS